MQNGWSGRNGRGGSNGGSGTNGRGQGPGGNLGSSPARSGANRWSDELDSIFERAPKEVAPVHKDDERNFFDERTEVKPHTMTCPNCQQTADYALTWLVRRKRDHPAGYADDATRARFEKARSYMVRRDDQVVCQNARCHKRFEIAGIQSVAFLEDAASGSVEDRAARIRAVFTGRNRE